MIDPSGAPFLLPPMTHQTKEKRNRQNERNEKEKGKAAYPLVPSRESQRKLHSRRAQPAFFPCVTRDSLPVQILLSLLRKLSSGADAPYPGTLQENQNRLRGLLLPKPLAQGGPRVFPPMRLPDFLPQFPDLGQPGPTLREQVVASLLLSSPAPPAPIIRRPANPVLQVDEAAGGWAKSVAEAP